MCKMGFIVKMKQKLRTNQNYFNLKTLCKKKISEEYLTSIFRCARHRHQISSDT